MELKLKENSEVTLKLSEEHREARQLSSYKLHAEQQMREALGAVVGWLGCDEPLKALQWRVEGCSVGLGAEAGKSTR